MTTLKVNVIRRPTIKVKVLPRFPSDVTVTSPILLSRVGGNYAFSLDINALISSLGSAFQPAGVDQEITSGATAAINVNSGTVRVNKIIGGAITLSLPPAATKIGPVLIADWKGDAGTNNITINLSGAETFSGGFTSWTIGADTGSVFLRPISGVGYTL